MNVLIVTDQLVKEDNNHFFCTENVYDILNRFANLGSLSVCAAKYAGKSANKVDADLSNLVQSSNIHFITKTYIFSNSKSRKIIESCVKASDLIIGYVPCINAYTAHHYAKKYKKRFLSYVVACPWDAFWNHGILGKIIAPYQYISLRKCLKNSEYALYVTESFLQKRYPCPGVVCGCSDVRIPNLDNQILNNRIALLEKMEKGEILRIATIASYSVKYKGQHFVIRALARLKKMGEKKFHYHLIGGGNKNRLAKVARELDVSDLVHFEGIVPHNQIFEKLDKMHIYIQPSLQEGLPRSVVEAMSRGLTCVCANTAAMPEMVESDYVVNRKSVDDIVNVLKGMTIEKMIIQANRNFEEAKKYEESVLDKKRNVFFDKVKKDFNVV